MPHSSRFDLHRGDRPLKVLVLGASGGIGSKLVALALCSGYDVTAAVRQPSLFRADPNVRVLECDARDPVAVGRAIAGQDVVFCTLGEAHKGPTTLYSTAIRNILSASGNPISVRIVMLSNFGLPHEKASDVVGKLLLWLVRRVVRHTLEDHQRALGILRKSRADWIAVRPMALTNGHPTAKFRVVVDNLPHKGRKISRADVAAFMLAQAAWPAFLRKAPAISY